MLMLVFVLAGCGVNTVHYGKTKDEWQKTLGKPTQKYYIRITDPTALTSLLVESPDPQCPLNQQAKVGDTVEVLYWERGKKSHTLKFLNDNQQPAAAWSSQRE